MTEDKAGPLLDSDSESESEEPKKLSINRRFAKEYEVRKQKQELTKARVRGEASSSDDDDDSESSEDEDGGLLTTRLDTNIMKTLNALRSKDQAIYDPETRFFDNETSSTASNENKNAQKEKPMRYKDVVRKQVLEDMKKGTTTNDHDEDKQPSYKAELAYDEEQKNIRKAFLSSTANDSDDDDDDDDDDDELMKVKRTHKPKDSSDGDFLAEVNKMEVGLQNRSQDDATNLVDPKGEVKDGDRFLLDYFKKRSWIDQDKDDASDGSDDESEQAVPMKTTDGNESDDSLDQLDKSDDFESQYNFRFEAAEAAGGQSGADFSNVGYARGQLMDTMRRKDDSRSKKRAARRERKEADRKAKEEQLKRLKNAKRQEMERNLSEIKKVLGEHDTENGDLDEAAILKMMEGDYDPERMEKLMAETFGDEYYEKEDSKWKSDKDVRADLSKDEEAADLVGEDGEGVVYDDDDNDEDDGNDDNNQQDMEEEPWVEEEEFAEEEAAEAETELEKKLKSKMQDELYKLDYEDIVGGMPTRFKYRKVEANNYGLSAQEILFAPDKTLRQYVSLKKMAPYREDGEYAVGRSKRKMFREMMEKELEEMETNDQTEPNDETEPAAEEVKEGGAKQKKRRKKRSKGSSKKQEDQDTEDNKTTSEQPAEDTKNDEEGNNDGSNNTTDAPGKKRRRRKKKSKKHKDSDSADNANTDAMPTEQSEATPEPPTKHDSASDQSEKKDSKETGTFDAEPETAKTTKAKTKKSRSEKRKSGGSSDGSSKKRRKKSKVEGISSSRLGAYGL